MYQSASKINQAAYFPAFGAIRLGGNAGQNQQIPTNVGGATFNDLVTLMQGGIDSNQLITKDSPFYFCQDLQNGCVVYAMNTYDEFDQRINRNFYDLVDANCGDSFALSNITWQNDTGSSGPYYKPPSSLVMYINKLNILNKKY